MSNIFANSLKAKPTETTSRGMERATTILNAARGLLAEDGMAEFSMRKVAARAGISLGNLQHYYGSKEALLDGLLTFMMDGYQNEIAVALAARTGDSAEQRFQAAVDLLLERTNDPSALCIFLEVWALASRPGFVADLVSKVRARERNAMKRLLRGIPAGPAQLDLDVRASMVVLVIEGLMVQLGQHGLRPAARAELASAARRTIFQLAGGERDRAAEA